MVSAAGRAWPDGRGIVVAFPTMTYVVARANGLFEFRESHMTGEGPRSRTLASFRVLTPEVSEQVLARASGSVDGASLRRMARRAGAPVPPSIPDGAAAQLLTGLAQGHRPRPAVERALRRALAGEEHQLDSNIRAAAAWIGATPQRRGETLRQLLLLVDSLPRRPTRQGKRFPRIESRPA